MNDSIFEKEIKDCDLKQSDEIATNKMTAKVKKCNHSINNKEG